MMLCAAHADSELLFSNSDFEKGTLENWTASGDVTTTQPTYLDNLTARKCDPSNHQGSYWFGTYENYDGKSGKPGSVRGDKATGKLVSVPFIVRKKFITFSIGAGSKDVGVKLLHNGNEELLCTGFNRESMDVVSFDASKYLGKEVQLVVFDNSRGGWGHINVDNFRGSDKSEGITAAGLNTVSPYRNGKKVYPEGVMEDEHRTFNTYGDVGYNQKLRPQFHFTSRKNWINDPNGMVYYDGEYHLFFQHSAKKNTVGCPKSWGHAVSTDMIHWKQLPHAILPYSGGAIWSGTAVVDHNNSLGKQVGDTKTIVAFFTKTHKPEFFQAIAYSTDRGRTFKFYNKGRAVVENQGFSKGERDPKVFWDEARQKWVMVLILGGGRPSTIRFFESDNLVDWRKAGDIKRHWAAECIDIFQLPVDGDSDRIKWVLTDASYDYEIGSFNGKEFVLEGKTHQGDFGDKCFYAAQVFNNAPNGRVIQIGWMKTPKNIFKDNMFTKAKMPFNQQLSFPCDLSLKTTKDGVRLYRTPVAEIESLIANTHSFSNISVAAANKSLEEIKPELVDLTVELVLNGNSTFDLNLCGQKISYGKEKKAHFPSGKQQLKGFGYDNTVCPAPIVDGRVKLRVLLDRSSIELFANDGAGVSTDYIIPDGSNRNISIEASSDVQIKRLVVNELKSSWVNE